LQLKVYSPEYFQGLWGDRNTANFDDEVYCFLQEFKNTLSAHEAFGKQQLTNKQCKTRGNNSNNNNQNRRHIYILHTIHLQWRHVLLYLPLKRLQKLLGKQLGEGDH
jgi:hypothetical protein